MLGYINSQKQVDILSFLERVGPCPLQSLEILFGRNAKKHLIKLRAKGYIYNITLSNIEFWSLQRYGYFNPLIQETVAWFAARVIEGGGQYMGNVCKSPTGVVFTVYPEIGQVLIILPNNSKYIACVDELKTSILKLCLKPLKMTE